MTSKLNVRNKISAIKSCADAAVRYDAVWTVKELKEMDRKSRNLLTTRGAHHPRTDTDHLCMKRTNGGSGLAWKAAYVSNWGAQ